MAIIIFDTKKISRCAALLVASIVSFPSIIPGCVCGKRETICVRRLAGVLESTHNIMRIIYFVLAACPKSKEDLLFDSRTFGTARLEYDWKL